MLLDTIITWKHPKAYFPHICTTHSYQDRINTIKACQATGLEVCSGGIISLGETMDQRLEMAFTLRDFKGEVSTHQYSQSNRGDCP